MLIAIAWAVLLGPAFCAGGVLAHECSTCQQPQSCHHEPNCAEDPCATILTPRHEPTPTTLERTDATPALPAAELLTECGRADGLALTPSEQRLAPPPARYPDSCLPLLN